MVSSFKSASKIEINHSSSRWKKYDTTNHYIKTHWHKRRAHLNLRIKYQDLFLFLFFLVKLKFKWIEFWGFNWVKIFQNAQRYIYYLSINKILIWPTRFKSIDLGFILIIRITFVGTKIGCYKWKANYLLGNEIQSSLFEWLRNWSLLGFP